jgi:CHAT domain-containing protein
MRYSDPNLFIAQWMFVASAELMRGDLRGAERAIEEADKIARGGRSIWQRDFAVALVRAELLARLGRREEGLRELTAAADEEIASLETESRFVWTHRHQWYDRLFRFLLGPDGDAALAARFLEQLRLHSTLDVLARDTVRPVSAAEEKATLQLQTQALMPGDSRSLAYAAYEDFVLHSRLQRARGRRERPLSIREIQAALDERTAIIEYIVAGGSLHAVVITGRDVRSVRLPVSSDAAGTKVRLLRALLAERSRAMSWRPVGIDLRRVLIEPLESSRALESIERLQIVPWGVLRDLPFAALITRDGRFLVEDYVIEYALSGSAAARAKTVSTADGPALFFGVGRFASSDLPDLPHAQDEARVIAARVRGEVRLAEQATETEVVRVTPHAGTLHFATHAVTEPDMSLLSRLVLTPGDGGDGYLTVPELLRMRLRGGLVTLGACRSAESHPSSGRDESDLERVGLVEAFLHAGAGRVLASLAPVADHSTAAFMRSFYDQGVPLDPAGRLAVTQRAMIRGEIGAVNGPPLRHPRHWSAFAVFSGAP